MKRYGNLFERIMLIDKTYTTSEYHLFEIEDSGKRREIAEYLAVNLNLTVKYNWQVFPSTVRGIDFVGYRCFGKYTLLRTSTKKNLCIKTKKLQRKKNQGKPLTKSEQSTVGSYSGILKWCDSARLKDKTINKFLGGQNGNSKRNARAKAA